MLILWQLKIDARYYYCYDCVCELFVPCVQLLLLAMYIIMIIKGSEPVMKQCHVPVMKQRAN